MLNFGGEKMSKSLGNVSRCGTRSRSGGRETLLMLFLGAHWRKPMDYTDETLAAAKARADGFREVSATRPSRAAPGTSSSRLLDDDFNTPEALAVMHEWRDHDLAAGRARGLRARLARASRRKRRRSCDELAQRRAQARAGGDFDEADRLRDEIEAAGWEVRDVAGDSGYRLVPKS